MDAATRLTVFDEPLSRVQDDTSFINTEDDQSFPEAGDWKSHDPLSAAENVTALHPSWDLALGTRKSSADHGRVSRSPLRSLSPPLPNVKNRLLKFAMVSFIALLTILAARTLKTKVSGAPLSGEHSAKALEGKGQMQFSQDRMQGEEAWQRDIAKGRHVDGRQLYLVAQPAESEKEIMEDREKALDDLQDFLERLNAN